MYIARPDRSSDEHARELVSAAGVATVFSAAGTLAATTLPILWSEDTVIAHIARANAHWRDLDGAEVLIVATAPDAYISPNWYPSKAEHGRAVPTWNYSSVHLRGTARIVTDTDRVLNFVEQLTNTHEAQFAEPWQVSDAPDSFVTQQLKAIVGIEISVAGVEAKAKWSRGRSAADQAAVLAALDRRDVEAAAEMRGSRTRRE
ncbi:FMN-binding negative transcriptional regulator [Gordonia sp. CPCC 205333]|uniref:FMN-binding negative transcriptional regulator n=1 Tax=Gordonia sp. CPCC 205333 TaxID=3140790 RepID=UPI003AF3E151